MGAISRRRFTAAAAAAPAALLAPPAGAQAMRELNIGVTPPTASEWPTYVAEELGYFTRYRLDPSFISIGSVAAIAQQVVAGSVDFGEVSATQVVEAVQNGATMRYFLEGVSRPPYAFVAQKQYKKYADLRGQRIIIGGPADITVVFTERMLASGGLKLSDVDFAYAGATADRFAALQSGSVAAAILFPPFSFRAIDEGYSLLGMLPDVLPEFPFGGWAATDGYGASHAEVLVDFCKAQLRGVRWLSDPANKPRALDMLLKHTNVQPSDAAKTYDALVGKNPAYPANGQVVPRTFALVVDALLELQIINPPRPNPTLFYTNVYAARAVAELAHEPKA